MMNSKVFKILLSILLILTTQTITIGSQKVLAAAIPPGTYKVGDILLIDKGPEPTSPREALSLIKGDSPYKERTGWSAYILKCDYKSAYEENGGKWDKKKFVNGKEVNPWVKYQTGDSGHQDRNDVFAVEGMEKRIKDALRKAYPGLENELYDYMKKNNIVLNIERAVPRNDSNYQGTFYNKDNPNANSAHCGPAVGGDGSEEAYFYQNDDVYLGASFTIEGGTCDDPEYAANNEPECSDKECDPKKEDCTKPPDPGGDGPGGSCSFEIVPEGTGGSMTGESINPTVSGSISSDSGEFDVTLGIPSSEYLRVDASGDEYLYGYDFSQNKGKVVYTLGVTKTFNLKWTTKTGSGKNEVITKHSETVKKKVDVKVERPWSYWEVLSYWVSQLKGATITNYALPNGTITFPANVNVSADATTDKNIENHVFPAECPIIDLGSQTLDGGSSKPSIPDFTGEAKGKAESQVGDTDVKNDSATFKSQTIMDDSRVTTNGPTPSEIPPAGQIQFGQGGLLIDPRKTNYFEAPSTGMMHYESVFNLNGKTPGDYPFPVNHVTVHTPVVIYAKASDDKEHDQRIKPPLRATPPNPDTDRHAFILDRPFQVTLPTVGQHRDIPGYGYRDFAKYIKAKQVKFPFDVYTETKVDFYSANTWINVPVDMETVTFFMPVWVPEGKYTVEFRAFAINALDGGDFGGAEHEANKTIPNGVVEGHPSAAHVATDSIEVDVVGRLYDLNITDIIDPNWKSVFTARDGYTPTNNKYFVGLHDIDNKRRQNLNEPFTLPVTHASNTNGIQNQAVKLGYKFRFDLKTKGDMHTFRDGIRIKPTFYFVSNDGRKRQEVDLYYHNDDRLFIQIGTSQDKTYRVVTLNEAARHVPTNELFNTGKYYYAYPYRFGLQEEALKHTQTSFVRHFIRNMTKKPIETGPYGWQLLNWNLRTSIGPLEPQLPPATIMIPRNETVAKEQRWYGEYSLPALTYAVPKGTKVAEAGLLGNLNTKNHPIYLKDGYIVVNFDLETIQDGKVQNPYLSYYNAYYMSQWTDMEAGKKQFTDAYGVRFNVEEGDMLYYHADQTALDDYSPSVTH